jgi:hypothetical protein
MWLLNCFMSHQLAAAAAAAAVAQGELLQQMAVNRYRLGVVLGAALEDMPAQAQRAAQFAEWESEINAYHAVSYFVLGCACGCGCGCLDPRNAPVPLSRAHRLHPTARYCCLLLICLRALLGVTASTPKHIRFFSLGGPLTYILPL